MYSMYITVQHPPPGSSVHSLHSIFLACNGSIASGRGLGMGLLPTYTHLIAYSYPSPSPPFPPPAISLASRLFILIRRQPLFSELSLCTSLQAFFPLLTRRCIVDTEHSAEISCFAVHFAPREEFPYSASLKATGRDLPLYSTVRIVSPALQCLCSHVSVPHHHHTTPPRSLNRSPFPQTPNIQNHGAPSLLQFNVPIPSLLLRAYSHYYSFTRPCVALSFRVDRGR